MVLLGISIGVLSVSLMNAMRKVPIMYRKYFFLRWKQREKGDCSYGSKP